MIADTGGYERGDRLAGDLCLEEISDLQQHFIATRSLCDDDTHPQPDVQSAFFPLFSDAVWSVAACTEHWFG